MASTNISMSIENFDIDWAGRRKKHVQKGLRHLLGVNNDDDIEYFSAAITPTNTCIFINLHKEANTTTLIVYCKTKQAHRTSTFVVLGKCMKIGQPMVSFLLGRLRVFQ